MGIREKYRQTGDGICTGDSFRYDQEVRCTQKGREAFQNIAMFLGIILTAEIMIAGAMVFNFDFKGADVIALIFAFMVLYSGVVAMLTDK